MGCVIAICGARIAPERMEAYLEAAKVGDVDFFKLRVGLKSEEYDSYCDLNNRKGKKEKLNESELKELTRYKSYILLESSLKYLDPSTFSCILATAIIFNTNDNTCLNFIEYLIRASNINPYLLDFEKQSLIELTIHNERHILFDYFIEKYVEYQSKKQPPNIYYTKDISNELQNELYLSSFERAHSTIMYNFKTETFQMYWSYCDILVCLAKALIRDDIHVLNKVLQIRNSNILANYPNSASSTLTRCISHFTFSLSAPVFDCVSLLDIDLTIRLYKKYEGNIPLCFLSQSLNVDVLAKLNRLLNKHVDDCDYDCDYDCEDEGGGNQGGGDGDDGGNDDNTVEKTRPTKYAESTEDLEEEAEKDREVFYLPLALWMREFGETKNTRLLFMVVNYISTWMIASDEDCIRLMKTVVFNYLAFLTAPMMPSHIDELQDDIDTNKLIIRRHMTNKKSEKAMNTNSESSSKRANKTDKKRNISSSYSMPHVDTPLNALEYETDLTFPDGGLGLSLTNSFISLSRSHLYLFEHTSEYNQIPQNKNQTSVTNDNELSYNSYAKNNTSASNGMSNHSSHLKQKKHSLDYYDMNLTQILHVNAISYIMLPEFVIENALLYKSIFRTANRTTSHLSRLKRIHKTELKQFTRNKLFLLDIFLTLHPELKNDQTCTQLLNYLFLIKEVLPDVFYSMHHQPSMTDSDCSQYIKSLITDIKQTWLPFAEKYNCKQLIEIFKMIMENPILFQSDEHSLLNDIQRLCNTAGLTVTDEGVDDILEIDILSCRRMVKSQRHTLIRKIVPKQYLEQLHSIRHQVSALLDEEDSKLHEDYLSTVQPFGVLSKDET